MARPRSTYTAEFKLRAVKMVTDQKLSVAEAARNLNVGENILCESGRCSSLRAATPSPDTATWPPAEDEFRRLRAEVTRLKAERDLLKNLGRQSRLVELTG